MQRNLQTAQCHARPTPLGPFSRDFLQALGKADRFYRKAEPLGAFHSNRFFREGGKVLFPLAHFPFEEISGGGIETSIDGSKAIFETF